MVHSSLKYHIRKHTAKPSTSAVNRKRKQNDNLKDENNKLKNEIKMLKETADEKYECTICCENEINRVLTCGHAFCHSCTNQFLEDKECPNCRQVPKGYQVVYFS